MVKIVLACTLVIWCSSLRTLHAQNIPCLEEVYADSAYLIDNYREVYSDNVFNSGRVYTNGERDIYITNSNVIFVSNDRGDTWRVGFYGPEINKWFLDAVVLDDSVFIGVGQEGLLVRSTDRGRTFTIVDLGHTRLLTTVAAWGRTVVYVDNIVAEIVISTDAGETWFRRPIDTTLLPEIWGVVEMCMASSEMLVLPIGNKSYRSTLMSTDLGRTWNVYPGCGTGRAVQYYNEKVGLTLGGVAYRYNPDGTQADDRSFGCVYKTTDGGKTYRMVLVDSTVPIVGFNGLTIHPNMCYVSWNQGDLWVRSIDKFDTNPFGYGTPRFMRDGRVFAFFSMQIMLDFAIRNTPATSVEENYPRSEGERCTTIDLYDTMGRHIARSQPNELTTVSEMLMKHRQILPTGPIVMLAVTESGEQRRSVECMPMP